MIVYVTVALHQGVLNDALVFRTKLSADKEGKQWISENGIVDDEDRESKSRNGTDLVAKKCEL